MTEEIVNRESPGYFFCRSRPFALGKQQFDNRWLQNSNMALAEIVLERLPTNSERRELRKSRILNYLERKGGYRFPDSVKETALEYAQFRCERCNSVVELEIHHILPIWFFLELVPQVFLPLVNTIANAEVLCSQCHNEEHQEWVEPEIESVIHYNHVSAQIFGVPLVDLITSDQIEDC